MKHAIAHPVEVEEISTEDGRKMLNERTLDRLGISAEDFLARLDRGEYDNTDDEAILRLAMLAPFAR